MKTFAVTGSRERLSKLVKARDRLLGIWPGSECTSESLEWTRPQLMAISRTEYPRTVIKEIDRADAVIHLTPEGTWEFVTVGRAVGYGTLDSLIKEESCRFLPLTNSTPRRHP